MNTPASAAAATGDARPLRTLRLAATQGGEGAAALALAICGDGPALVVFLHGIGGNRSNWTRQLRHIGDLATAVAWDARGYGDSEDYTGALAMRDFRDDLDRVLDAFGAARAHLVGLSMGGMIALDYCAHRPERVASLLLADTVPGPARDLPPAAIEDFLRLRRAPLEAGQTPADIAPAVARSLVAPHADATTLAQLEASIAALHRDSYLKTLETVTRHRGPAPEALAAIASARPVLLVCGSEDRLTPPERMRKLAAEMPGARFEIIDGAGHLSNIERPQRFDALLRDFLSPLI